MLAVGLWSVTDFLCTHVPPSDDGAHLLDWCNLPHMMDYADESIDTEGSMHDTSTISWKETSTVFESVTSASADDEDADDESDPSYEDGDAETHALVAHAARMNNGRARRLRMADFRNYRARRVRASEARTKRTITAPDSHVAIESAQQSAAATMSGSSYPSDYTGDGPTGQDVVDTGGELYIVKSKIVGHYYRSALRQYMVAADKKRNMNAVVLLRKMYVAGGASQPVVIYPRLRACNEKLRSLQVRVLEKTVNHIIRRSIYTSEKARMAISSAVAAVTAAKIAVAAATSVPEVTSHTQHVGECNTLPYGECSKKFADTFALPTFTLQRLLSLADEILGSDWLSEMPQVRTHILRRALHCTITSTSGITRPEPFAVQTTVNTLRMLYRTIPRYFVINHSPNKDFDTNYFPANYYALY
jgi:hypothetical protein